MNKRMKIYYPTRQIVMSVRADILLGMRDRSMLAEQIWRGSRNILAERIWRGK